MTFLTANETRFEIHPQRIPAADCHGALSAVSNGGETRIVRK
jgi:hypothetical protein